MLEDTHHRRVVLQFPTMPKKRDYTATNRLKELRQAAGVTLQDLADALNTTTAQIHRLETGDRQMTLRWMQRLAVALGVTPADMLLPADGGLDPRERELVDTVREVPPPYRGAFYSLMESQQPYRAQPEVHELLPRKKA